jgi:hypothetical protein
MNAPRLYCPVLTTEKMKIKSSRSFRFKKLNGKQSLLEDGFLRLKNGAENDYLCHPAYFRCTPAHDLQLV